MHCVYFVNGQLFKSKQRGVTFFFPLLLFQKAQLCCTAGQSVLTSCLLLLPQVKALPPFRKRKYPFNPQTDHSRCCGKHFPGKDIWTLDKLYVKSIQPYPDAFSIALFIWRRLLLPPSSSVSFDSWVLKMKRTQDEWHFICWAHRGQSGFYIYGRRDHLYPVLASAREAGIGDIFPLKGSSITSNHQSVTIGNNCLPLRWQFYTPQKNVPAFIRKAFRRKPNIKRICIARLCATLIGSVGHLVVLKMIRIIFDGNTKDVKSAGLLWPISKRLMKLPTD